MSKLDPQENAGPAGRGLGDYELQGCFHLLVVSCSLAIGLRVEAKILEGHCQPGELAELIPEVGGELETPVGHSVQQETMELKKRWVWVHGVARPGMAAQQGRRRRSLALNLLLPEVSFENDASC